MRCNNSISKGLKKRDSYDKKTLNHNLHRIILWNALPRQQPLKKWKQMLLLKYYLRYQMKLNQYCYIICHGVQENLLFPYCVTLKYSLHIYIIITEWGNWMSKIVIMDKKIEFKLHYLYK